jgi:hypothetical protein
MRFAPVWIAALVVVAIVVVSRPARSGCDNPGVSQGYEQCRQYPSCECVSENIPCAHGTWFTQYSVNPANCHGPGPRPPAGSGAGSGSNKPNKPTPCEMMQKWLDNERKFLAAYEDDDLLGLAIAQGWGPNLYNTMVWRSVHPGGLPPSNGGGVMWTNPRTCEIHNYQAGCQWLLQQGLPQSACSISLAHEQVHAAQCKHKDPNYDPTDLQQYRDREVEAHKHTIDDIEKDLKDHCS